MTRQLRCVPALALVLWLCAPAARAQELVDTPPPADAPAPVTAPEQALPADAPAADSRLQPEPGPDSPAPSQAAATPTAPDHAAPVERRFSPTEFRNNAWKGVWLLTLVIGAPSVVMVLVPGLVVSAVWAAVGALLVGAGWTNVHQSRSPMVQVFAVAALVAAGVGAGLTGVAVLLVPMAYVVWRVLTLVFLPLPGDTQPRAARTRRGLWFVGMDALVHAVVLAGSAVAGVVVGGAVGAGLLVGSLFAPFTICFPFCLPWPQVVARADGSALANVTGVPLLMALSGAGLCLGGLAAAQGVTPLMAMWPQARARRDAPQDGALEEPGESGDLELQDINATSTPPVTPAEEP